MPAIWHEIVLIDNAVLIGTMGLPRAAWLGIVLPSALEVVMQSIESTNS